jgi:hypothetical protein
MRVKVVYLDGDSIKKREKQINEVLEILEKAPVKYNCFKLYNDELIIFYEEE